MASISHHITPLVINSLGGEHIHANTHTYRHPHRNNFKKPGVRWSVASTLLVLVIILTYDVKLFFGMMSLNTGSPTYSKLFLVVPVKLSTCTMMVATPSSLSGVLHVMNFLQDNMP